MVKDLRFTPLQRVMFRELCKSAGDPLTQSELARRVSASSAGVSKALVGMGDVVSVRSDVRLGVLLVELARTREARSMKRVENLGQIYDSGLFDYLIDAVPGSTIVLFGSYARGEDTARSDIDIAIIGAREKPLDLSSYGTVLARTVNVSWFSSIDDLSVPMRESLWSGIPLV